MNRLQTDELAAYPLIGSIQNSVGMGFIGNQTLMPIVNALGGRVAHVTSSFASAHAGFAGRATWIAEPNEFRREVSFLISQRPGLMVVGFLPKPIHVDIVVTALYEYKGVILLDPVIGDYKKGLFVSQETARAIKDRLLPISQLITPNRFEAEVLIGGADRAMTEWGYLNALYDLGPESVVITSFERDLEKRRIRSLYTNGYSYHRISSPYYPAYPGHGVGDTFAACFAAFIALGGSQLAAALLASALAARAVANSGKYGGATVDPVAALAKWNPLGYHVEDERAIRFCEKSNVDNETLRATAIDAPRLKFAPPRHKIIYS